MAIGMGLRWVYILNEVHSLVFIRDKFGSWLSQFKEGGGFCTLIQSQICYDLGFTYVYLASLIPSV